MHKLTILGGADIGGSCYLLETDDGLRILLDCGMRPNHAYTEHPDIPEPESIDAVFLTHAHIDHIGALPYTAAVCPNARIFASAHTKQFIRYQLAETIAEYIGADTEALRYSNDLLCRLLMNRIETVELNQRTALRGRDGTLCRFSLFSAGHIPGAVMVYLDTGGHRILYTGDFSAQPTALTDTYTIPLGVRPDTIILCGVNAGHADERYSSTSSAQIERELCETVRCIKGTVVRIRQLTKGLELLAMIDRLHRQGQLPVCSVYLCDSIWKLAQEFEMSSPSFRLPLYMRPLSERNPAEREVIFLTHSNKISGDLGEYPAITPHFSLHASYHELVTFSRTFSPSRIFVVHTPRSAHNGKFARALARDGIAVTYTVNKAAYQF